MRHLKKAATRLVSAADPPHPDDAVGVPGEEGAPVRAPAHAGAVENLQGRAANERGLSCSSSR